MIQGNALSQSNVFGMTSTSVNKSTKISLRFRFATVMISRKAVKKFQVSSVEGDDGLKPVEEAEDAHHVYEFWVDNTTWHGIKVASLQHTIQFRLLFTNIFHQTLLQSCRHYHYVFTRMKSLKVFLQ